MEYRRLGRSGLQLSLLSFGSWVTFHQQLDDSLADELTGIAYDHGVNFFDNAEGYAGGESELQMGRVFKKKRWERSSYVLSSKVFFGTHGNSNKPNQGGLCRKHIVEACHEALQRLQVEYLDLFFCHRPDPNTPIDEVVWSMNLLIQQGKILYWGTSEWSAAEIMEAHAVAEKYRLLGPVMEQPEYNLFNRIKIERDFLPIFQHVGLGTTIWSPLASGLLSGKYNTEVPQDSRLARPELSWLKQRHLVDGKIEKVRQLKRISDRLGTSPAVLSIAWCLSNPNVTTAILGASRSSQLLENLKAVEFYPHITTELKEEIEGIMQTKPDFATN